MPKDVKVVFVLCFIALAVWFLLVIARGGKDNGYSNPDANVNVNAVVKPQQKTPVVTQPLVPQSFPLRQLNSIRPNSATAATSSAVSQASPGEKYVIQSGDNYYKIAKKFYGDGTLWIKLHEANKDIFPNENNLKVGVEIVIPDLENSPAVTFAPSSAQQPQTPSAGESYTIKKGDTLFDISRQFYGTGKYWREIKQYNAALIPDENNLPVGQTIRIPKIQ